MAKTATQQEPSELSRLFPDRIYKLTTGEEVEVKPVTFGKLKVFLDSISSLLSKLDAAGVTDIADPASWTVMLGAAHEEIGKIMCALLDKDSQWVDALELMDAVSLLGMIIDQNVNDLTKKKFNELASRIKGLSQSLPSS